MEDEANDGDRGRSSIAKRILVPTDFGEAAEAALAYAVRLAGITAGEVIVLHAFEVMTSAFPGAPLGIPAELEERMLAGAQMELDKLVSFHVDAGVPIHAFIEPGDAWQTINEVARREDADLVVMGTHGRRGLPRALLGSVAEKVVRTSPVPVLTLHGDTNDEASRATDARRERGDA